MKAMKRLTSPVCRGFVVLVGLLGWATLTQAQGPPSTGNAVIEDVRIIGPRYVSTEYVAQRLSTRPGTTYNSAVAQEDVRRLYKTNRFRSVQVRLSKQPSGKLIVYFDVVDFPNRIREVVYKYPYFSSFKDKDLEVVTGLRVGQPLNPIVNKMATQQIVRHLRDKGYPFASCRLLEGGKTTDTRVVLQITEGPKVFISSIRFEGNSWLSDARLRTLINSKTTTLGIKKLSKPYIPPMVDQDVSSLMEYYRAFGFHDVQVWREVQWAPNNETVKIIFHISEGKRYRIRGEVKVVGSKHFKGDELQRIVHLQPGDYYDRKTIGTEINGITDYVGRTGRRARVKEKITYHENNECSVSYQVNEESQARVGQIIIVGNRVTKQRVILRELLLYPGQILSYPAIRESEARLVRRNLFKSDPATGVRPTITVLDDREGDPTVKDLLVNIEEDRTGSLLFGVGFNSSAGATGSIVLNERNFDILNVPTSIDDLLGGRAFRGGGQEFRLEAIPGTQLQRYSVSFREPYLFDTDFALSLSGFYYTRFYTEYHERRVGGRVGVTRRLNDRWSSRINFRLENVDVRNVPFFAPPDYTNVAGENLLIGTSVGFTRDTRDSVIRATQGSLFDVSVEGVTGAQDYPIFLASFSKYLTVYERNDGSGRHVLASRSQFGYAGANAPVFERFFAGGFRTLRGFQFRGVGPETNQFKVGGDFLFLNSLEYSVPVTANDKVQFVAFVDTGTVERRMELKNYRVSAGFGVRLSVPFMGPVPLALDFGFPIVKGPFDDEQIFNFYLGLQR